MAGGFPLWFAACLRELNPPGLAVSYAARPGLAAHLAARLSPGDLLLTLGAGDVTQVAGEVLGRLEAGAPT